MPRANPNRGGGGNGGFRSNQNRWSHDKYEGEFLVCYSIFFFLGNSQIYEII
jgi:hypothetical protein